MNTANKLTLLRVALIPAFMSVLYVEFPFHMYIALGIFLLACFTDFADGYIARHRNQITDFGKFMDPLADKVLVMAAMVWLVQAGLLPGWVLLVVITREFAVTALRLVAVDSGVVIAAGWSGKVKTAATMVALSFMLIRCPELLNTICWVVILLTTVYSGIEYFWCNRDMLKMKTK